MPKTWYSVQAKAADQPASVSIRGYIGEFGVTDRDFIASVEALGPLEELLVRINSRGGEVDHALSIFNFLRNLGATVTVRVEGVAMSSGSIIAMAGDKILMPANTVMMVHNPWTYVAGDAKALRQIADQLETWEQVLIDTYVARTGKTADEVKALLDEETHMTAAEAVELGFADEVEPIERAGATAVALACALGIPESVLSRIQQIEQAAGAAAADEGSQGQSEQTADEPDTTTPGVSEAAKKPALAIQISDMAKAYGLESMADVFVVDLALPDITAAEARIAQARELNELCKLAKKPEMARALILSGATYADACARLTNARAEEDEGRVTDNHLSSGTPLTHAPQAAVTTAGIWAARTTSVR